MSFPAPSDISQNDTEMLKEQHCEMQWWHEKEQQSLLQLQEAAEACCAECAAQKARREVEAKAKEEAKKQRIVEKKKKLEYIQRLWDEVLEKEAALLEGLRDSRLWNLSARKLLPEMRRGNSPPRKLKGSNKGSTVGMLQSRWRC